VLEVTDGIVLVALTLASMMVILATQAVLTPVLTKETQATLVFLRVLLDLSVAEMVVQEPRAQD
jgi:hypothetical protein